MVGNEEGARYLRPFSSSIQLRITLMSVAGGRMVVTMSPGTNKPMNVPLGVMSYWVRMLGAPGFTNGR